MDALPLFSTFAIIALVELGDKTHFVIRLGTGRILFYLEARSAFL
jgi:putative Ca2+/H+ antiporter (TMEM165/GDT1 family)